MIPPGTQGASEAGKKTPAVFGNEGIVESQEIPERFDFPPRLACREDEGNTSISKPLQGGTGGGKGIVLMIQKGPVEIGEDGHPVFEASRPVHDNQSFPYPDSEWKVLRTVQRRDAQLRSGISTGHGDLEKTEAVEKSHQRLPGVIMVRYPFHGTPGDFQ